MGEFVEQICSHNVEFKYFECEESIPFEEVPESEIEYVRIKINKGYIAGELYYLDKNQREFRGWWEIM